MQITESKLLGIKINDSGEEVELTILDIRGKLFTIKLHNVEKLIITEFRQQNIIDYMTHCKIGSIKKEIEDIAIFLAPRNLIDEEKSKSNTVAEDITNRVTLGKLELIEITSIFGAQIIASFSSMSIE